MGGRSQGGGGGGKLAVISPPASKYRSQLQRRVAAAGSIEQFVWTFYTPRRCGAVRCGAARCGAVRRSAVVRRGAVVGRGAVRASRRMLGMSTMVSLGYGGP